MSLLTTPLIISDGTASRTFNWLRQVPNKVAGLYTETAATAKSESQLATSHTTQKSGTERHLFQRSEIVALVDPDVGGITDDLILVNITVYHNKKHNELEVEKQLNLAIAAASVAGFTAALMRKEI